VWRVLVAGGCRWGCGRNILSEVTDDRDDDPVRRLADDLQIDVERIEAEERAAAYRLSMIAAGRRKGGLLGAAAAGAMIGLRDIYEGPPKQDDIVIEIESSGEPTDIDVDGILGSVDDIDYWAPPPRDLGD
jgi:hypothetical protein